MVEDYKYYELERKINDTLHECLVEKRFLVNRLEKLQARKEQIFSEMYTSRAGRAAENPFTVREELAELDAKIKETKKRIAFIEKLVAILV